MTATPFRPPALLGVLALFAAGCSQPSPLGATARPAPAADPIAAIGHGAVVGRDGKEVQLTGPFIEMAQNYYLDELLAAAKGNDREKPIPDADIEAARKAIAAATEDKILANALLIDWLIEKVKPARRSKVTNANHALRWHYVLHIQKNPVLPDKNEWGKGLKPDAAKKLGEQLGIAVFAVTNASGEEYCRECLNAGVPVPNMMFGAEWQFIGVVDDEFLSDGLRAELWLHESTSPPGVCVALPRFDNENRAKLFGVICLGQGTSKVCFFDNPRNVFYTKGVPIDFKKSFLGGADLVANAQGECSDCHAGENPYVVHPEKPAFAAIRGKIQSPAWYSPLVVSFWAQNPGPSNQLDAVPSERWCDECHVAGYAGRFPDISSQLPEYCNTVLRLAAVDLTPKRTMPMPVGSTDRNKFLNHIASLNGSCGMPPTGGGVVVDDPAPPDDPGMLSPPAVIDPIYACTTTVGVRGAVLDAKVTVFVNGAAVGMPIFPARNTEELVFNNLPALNVGDVVTARQEKDGVKVDSAPVTVRDHKVDYPMGLPAPTIDPTLVYECAEVIAVRHVPGAKVTVLSNGAMPATATGGPSGWTVFRPAKQPFVFDDRFKATVSLCTDTSPESAEVKAIKAPPSIPPATFIPATPVEGQQLVRLETLTNGAKTEVFVTGHGSVGGISWPVSYFSQFDVATPLGRPLNPGDKLSATQTLCKAKSTGETPPAGKCPDLPAPRIRHPIVGTNYVVVAQAVPGARIRVYDAANKEIGDGSGTVIILTRPLTGTDTLTVYQQVGRCISKGYRVSARNPIG